MANARDINLDIVGHDHTGRATRSAGQNFDRLKRKVDGVDDVAAAASVSVAGLSVRMGATASKMLGRAGIVAAAGAAYAAFKVLPIAASAAAGGIVAALGGGLAAIGVLAAARNEKVRKEFDKTKEHIKKAAPEFGKPFEPVLINVARRIRETFDFFRPALQTSLDSMAPVLDQFTRQFVKGLEKLEPALGPLTGAFERLVAAVGPKIPGLFEDFATAIENVSTAVNNNPQAFATMVSGIGDATVKLTEFIGFLSQLPLNAELAWAQVTLVVREAVSDVADSLADLPGPVGRSFQSFADSARAKVAESQRIIDSLNTRKAQGEIATLKSKQDALKNKLLTVGLSVPEYQRTLQQLAEVNARLDKLQNKTITVTSRYVQINIERNYRGNPVTGANPSAGWKGSAGDTLVTRHLAPTFATSGATLVGAPVGGAMTFQGGPTNVDARVFLDGRQIAAVTRSVVHDEQGRAAFRARWGRRS